MRATQAVSGRPIRRFDRPCRTLAATATATAIAAVHLTAVGEIRQESFALNAPRNAGLKIAHPTEAGGSDAASASLVTDILPRVEGFLSNGREGRPRMEDSAVALDASKLVLQTDADVRVHFLGENSRHLYSPGYQVTGNGTPAVAWAAPGLVSFAYAMPDSPYLILGFEELYGGDVRNLGRLLFAVDIGAANVAALISTPEPGTAACLGALLILGFACKHLHDARRDPTPKTPTVAAMKPTPPQGPPPSSL